jgi:hypothetical protein
MQSVSSLPSEQFVESATIGPAFAIGFFFSFRLVLVLFSVRVLGTDPRTGSAMALALDFFLFAVVCFHSLGFANRTFRLCCDCRAFGRSLSFYLSHFFLLQSGVE